MIRYFNHETPAMSHTLYCKKSGEGPRAIFWGHGWGQDHRAFEPLAESLSRLGRHVVLDFPGFGTSPEPQAIWGTEDYADAMADFIRAQTGEGEKIIWCGHSFGGRVGVQLAARHPDLVAGLFLVAAAGLPRKRPLWQKLYFKGRVALFKTLKKLIPLGLSEEWLKTKFGSADYKNVSGTMRGIFVRTVNEDLSTVAQSVSCPVLLMYGTQDSETPPEIGRRYAQLIPRAEMIELEGLDHYTVLGAGRHQLASALQRFIKNLDE
ncbi:MAG: alpha/beta hydrolase [Alphaproteobacteria bacterium]|nr:alpha/beta hydrolase [Alphaproteobacteria bacterium]